MTDKSFTNRLGGKLSIGAKLLTIASNARTNDHLKRARISAGVKKRHPPL
jgi:hypothetical protein